MAVRKHYLVAALAALAVTAGPAVGSASAGIFLCVPTTAGAAVTSGGSAGSCGASTPVELPQSRADQQTLLSLLQYMTFNPSGVMGKPTVTFKGANVQIVNGTGATSTLNGTGNLFLGYNESAGSQTGSHNLVLNAGHSFSSFGSILAGSRNTSTAAASVVFGYNNTATGYHSSVLAGYNNSASQYASAVSGGHDNKASGPTGTVSGGSRNIAEGPAASVAGGVGNVAKGQETSILGGNTNTAVGNWSTLTGGKLNITNAVSGTGDGTHYWVRMDGNGVKLADSGTLRGGYSIQTYDYTNGYSLIWFRGMDVAKCSVSVEPDGSTDAEIAYRYETGEYVYVQTKRAGQPVDGIGLSVSLDCANPTT